MIFLVASTLWSVDADGEDLTGLDSLIRIQFLLDCESQEDAYEVLNGPITGVLEGGPLCFLTGVESDCDEGVIEELEEFVPEPEHEGIRRLGGYVNKGKCRNCSKGRRALRAANQWKNGFRGTLTIAAKQWCKDMASTNSCCNGKVISFLSYELE